MSINPHDRLATMYRMINMISLRHSVTPDEAMMLVISILIDQVEEQGAGLTTLEQAQRRREG